MQYVFPSEVILPVNLDTTDPDTENILTCQYDDGVTVTNVLTGVTGEIFDAANQIGPTEPDGTRISATWSTGKPVGIDDNPYKLLQTIIDVIQEYCLSFDSPSQSIAIPFIGNYSGTLTESDGTETPISGSGTYTRDGTSPIKISRITATDDNDFHYFDYNKTKDDTVESTTSSLTCTLSGFPVDSGYVRNGSGDIIGYLIGGGTTVTLPLVGSYSGNITYVDDSTAPISGSGNLVLDNTQPQAIKSVAVTDDNGLHDYDATTGDENQWPDLTLANDAVITNASTVKWQRAVPVDVFTVGNGLQWDYQDLDTAINDTDSNTNCVHYYVMEDFITPVKILFRDNLGDRFVLGKSGKKYTLLENTDTAGTVPSFRTNNTTGLTPLPIVRFQHLELVTPNTEALMQNADGFGNGALYLFDCLAHPKDRTDAAASTVGIIGCITQNSIIDNFAGFGVDGGEITNSLVMDCAKVSGIRYCVRNAVTYNVVARVVGTGNDFAFNNCTGSGNVSADGTAPVGDNNQTNVDMTGWFVDEVAYDYRVTSTGQPVLTGTGWNNSNIVEWAWFSGGIGETIIVESGSYSTTGTETPVNAQLNIVTSSGNYLLTGTETNLKIAYRELIESGSYNLTGTDVTLIYTPVTPGDIIIVESGVYSLAGDEVILSADFNIVADSGNYLQTGTDTPIKYGANITLDSGSYSVFGTDLNLVVGYGIIASTASYTLTGTNVTLRYSGDLAQKIGIVTAGFKLNEITVRFKG